MDIGIFSTTVPDIEDVEFVRTSLVRDQSDAHYLWYLLSGSGYLHVDCNTEDLVSVEIGNDTYDVERALKSIEGTKSLNSLLVKTDTAHAYKWADSNIDKLAVVCLALYRALT